MDPNLISGHVIDAAIKVHSALGPGLLESAYKGCLAHELRARGMTALAEVELPVHYHGLTIDVGYKIDLLVEDRVIVELKAVERMHPIFTAQILSYMKLSGKNLGLLINFHVLHLKDGIQRFIL